MQDRELLMRAIETAKQKGASYADVRVNRYLRQSINTREKRVTSITNRESFGTGIRVLVDGTWGFAASREVSPAEVDRVAAQAVAIARANRAAQGKPVVLAPVEAYKDTWQTPVTKDPFRVPTERKVDLLLAINAAALKNGAAFCTSYLHFVKEEKQFASTEGSEIEQIIIRQMPGFTVTAVDRKAGKFKTRNSLAEPIGTGYEWIESYPWLEEAATAAEQAVRKLSAKSVEPGKYDLILAPSNLWLTIHESVGHPTELDRAMGYEANFAGTSFLTPDKLGKFKFGSDIVNFFADRTQPMALATLGYDDDGVPTHEWDIVRKGIFVDYQTTREQAAWIGKESSHACSHADSWGSVPFQRMPNLSLRPGEEKLTLEELIAGTKRGILGEGRSSYSIDQQRYNFQFSAQLFWEIRDGRIAGLIEDAAYQAITPEFWGSCDRICSDGYALGGSFYDGKGEPGQANAVSHGCAPARFRNVNIINTARSM
ncbi:MAG TPA: TldD/PmbA family protein [Thermoanaerobaculia bacterium]|nr:TldD/PmbA family protein [Thermoanaerobaculia bacterium]